MTKQEFFSFMQYSVIKAGATDYNIKHVGGVIILTYVIKGVKYAESVHKTDSQLVYSRYVRWFYSIIQSLVW